jgi:hypothetical protein
MTEDIEFGKTEEKPRSKEGLTDVVARVATFAVNRSRGAALINMSEVEISQEEAIESLPTYYHHVSVQDILEGKAEMPRAKTALVVTGYSRDFYQKREEEDRIESFIRGTANMRNLNAGEFSLLVLSDSLPDEGVFHNPSLPWFNGPFQGDDSVWSIRHSSSSPRIELIRHNLKSETIREPKVGKVKNWVDKQTILFEPF